MITPQHHADAALLSRRTVLRGALLSFSLVLWYLGMNSQAGVGEEGPRELFAGADSVDAAFDCVSNVG
ncbi:hypothetical protein, partial [Streptomyces sp. NPDC007904]|uniref:hypothetical protein n=1 Tax=Streptomyces sp. NPDC007904 TaxID=3364787 RepID=UPI0036E3CFBC